MIFKWQETKLSIDSHPSGQTASQHNMFHQYWYWHDIHFCTFDFLSVVLVTDFSKEYMCLLITEHLTIDKWYRSKYHSEQVLFDENLLDCRRFLWSLQFPPPCNEPTLIKVKQYWLVHKTQNTPLILEQTISCSSLGLM